MNSRIKKPALELPRSLVNQILAHAQQNPDEEICGLISSKKQVATKYYRIANTASDKAHQFEMNGAEQIGAMKKMRSQGEEIMAIVHSHPDAPAIPSTLDKEANGYPDTYYLIVSLNTKGVLELRCFLLINGKFESAELVLEQAT